MSFLKKLFGGGDEEPPAVIEYEGFKIIPEPIAEGPKFRLAARITQEMDGEVKEHHFIRADTLDSKDQAEDAAVNKAKQMIDQMGERIFD
ncbi:MAG: HlyU family transcriptional regulator [Pseudomonadota bacterium]